MSTHPAELKVDCPDGHFLLDESEAELEAGGV